MESTGAKTDVRRMVYCWKCGSELRDDAVFCYKCGTPVHKSIGVQGRTGFEVLRDDRVAQDHWLRRVIAVVIDAVIVSLVFSLLEFLIAIPYFFTVGSSQFSTFPSWWNFWWWGPVGAFGLVGSLVFLYFLLAETVYARTIGKELMGLKVERIDGKPVNFRSSLVRNFSKIYWIFLFIDVAVGLGTVGEFTQKWSDRYIGTRVVETRIHSRLIRDDMHL